jgi:hypothetical protein
MPMARTELEDLTNVTAAALQGHLRGARAAGVGHDRVTSARCFSRHGRRAHRVQQDVDLDPSPAALRHRLRQLAGDLAVLVAVLGVRDGGSGAADGLQDSRVDLLAVEEKRQAGAPTIGACACASRVGKKAGSPRLTGGGVRWTGTLEQPPTTTGATSARAHAKFRRRRPARGVAPG